MTNTKTVLPAFNLQLFADGGASAGASTGTGTTTSGDPSTNSVPAENKTANQKVIYGKQTTDTLDNGNSATTQEQRKSFEDLVKSEEYSAEAKEYMNKHFGKRLSKYKGIEEENSKMRKILDMQNFRYGLDTNSATYLDDFASKVENDTKLYEEEALASGIPTEEYMKIKNAERIIAQNKVNEANRLRNESVQKHITNLFEQAEQMKSEFANFDLEKEMNNPTFKRLVDTPELGGVGLSLKDAFFAVHHKDIMNATMNNAVNQAVINTANSVATNKARPAENGLSNNSPVVVKDDPSKFTLEDFKRIREEYRRTGYRPRF